MIKLAFSKGAQKLCRERPGGQLGNLLASVPEVTEYGLKKGGRPCPPREQLPLRSTECQAPC